MLKLEKGAGGAWWYCYYGMFVSYSIKFDFGD
jgi:hypothetical protein